MVAKINRRTASVATDDGRSWLRISCDMNSRSDSVNTKTGIKCDPVFPVSLRLGL